MTELQQIRGMLELVLRQLDEMRAMMEEKKAPLTITEFAKLSGYSQTTIARRIKTGEIDRKDGRIPYRELRRLLS